MAKGTANPKTKIATKTRKTAAKPSTNKPTAKATRDPIDAVSADEVETVRKTLPRFLFRAWSPTSGGNARLNTEQAIAPLAFLDTTDIDSFYDTSRQKLAQLANQHLHGQLTEPVYSSWSQSLAFVLSIGASHHSNACISILDVSKLDPSVVVMPTWAMSEVLRHPVSVFAHQYLAFGIISGPSYEAIPRSQIRGVGFIDNPINHSTADYFKRDEKPEPGAPLLHMKIRSIAAYAAQLYGPDFQLAMATYMLAMVDYHGNVDDQTLLKALAKFPMPRDWKSDHRLLEASSMDTHEFRETI